jgi:hypothetical protein
MTFRQITPNPIRAALLVAIGTVLLLCACGGGGDSTSCDASSGTGSISFNLDWVHPGPQPSLEKSPSGDVCVDYLIDTVRATVQDASGTTNMTQHWDCSAHRGTIDKVPNGSEYSLTVEGIVGGNVDWRNQITGITVAGCQDTRSEIQMRYIGDDQTPPAVSEHYPGSEDTGVFLNINITATFTEDVVAASVNKSSCTLYQNGDAEPVSYELSYNASAKTVIIIPNSHLIPNTTYRVTITTAVEDHAGLTMASDVSWTFTTNDAIRPLLVWDERNWDESLWQEK